MQSIDADAELRRVEAARYALLRRLALAMRDRMLVHLEPITMMSEVIERRLQQPAPDVARIEGEMAKVHGFARTAVGVNLDIVSWLAPEAQARVPLDAGARECMALLGSQFGFGGFSLRHEPGGGHAVRLAALRTVLAAVLFAIADEAGGPARLTVAGDPAAPVLAVRMERDPAATGRAAHLPYRPLTWQEAQALAQAEGVELARDGAVATLRFPA